MKTRFMLLALCLACGRHAANSATDSAADRMQELGGRAANQAKLATAIATGLMRDGPAPTLAAAPTPASLPPNEAIADVDFSADRKLVRNAEFRIQVENVGRAMARIDTVAAARGATIADTRASRDPNGRGDGRVVIRVPAPKLDPLLGELRGIGKVQEEETSTDDITKQFTDLETSITVKEETVSRLRALLATRTAKLADVLDLERELSRTVTELERMKGERRYYEQQVAMSTVTIALFEPNVIVASGVRTSARDALQHSLALLHGSALTVLYTLTFLAPWLPMLALAWWLFTRIRSRRIASIATSSTPTA